MDLKFTVTPKFLYGFPTQYSLGPLDPNEVHWIPHWKGPLEVQVEVDGGAPFILTRKTYEELLPLDPRVQQLEQYLIQNETIEKYPPALSNRHR